MEEQDTKSVVNHFEAGANCQVFNGPVSGCVFAMPGSTVNQYAAQEPSNSASGYDVSLPDVLRTPEAEMLMAKAVAEGWLDERWQPKVSSTEAALLAMRIAECLDIKAVWKVFWVSSGGFIRFDLAISSLKTLAALPETFIS
jgi:hypothetical protein